MSKEKRLGRGLEALLGRSLETPAETTAPTETPESSASTHNYPEVKLGLVTADDDSQDDLQSESPADSTGYDQGAITQDGDGQKWLGLSSITTNPYQPRQHFDEAEIADLCDSIRTHGFLQPIVVRQYGDQYQIIAGERRFRAAQLASWERIPVLVRNVDDREMAELAIVENVQRKDLNAIEKAASFQRYLQEYGCTQEELAGRVNVDRSTVANLIRLLELPEQVKQLVIAGEISQGHARSLLPLGDEFEQCKFAKQIKSDSLSVRATEQLVQDHIRQADGEQLSIASGTNSSPAKPAFGSGQHLTQLEEQFRLTLGTKVDVKQTAKGRGKITIHFKNHEEFERLQQLIMSERAAA